MPGSPSRATRFETIRIAWDPANPLNGERPTIADLSIHAEGGAHSPAVPAQLPHQPVDVEERDINKTPPDRAFLEQHVDETEFLDFVSTRSPVFKQRPLPKSKKEAIDLMMEQPNLIKRPILIRGSNVTFGFDKDKYRA